MEKIVNYLLLIIVFVFDPLAVSLVITANFVYEKEINNSIRSKDRSLHVTSIDKDSERTNKSNNSSKFKNTKPISETDKPISSTDNASISGKETSNTTTEKTSRNERTEKTGDEPISRVSEYEKERQKIVMGSQNASTKKRMLQELSKKWNNLGFDKKKENTQGSKSNKESQDS